MSDEKFNFRTRINTVCKLTYCHIHNLCRIRKHLNLDQAMCLAPGLVSSRLDYCNSLLHGIAVRDMLKLQRVQNCLAMVVTRADRFAPSTPPPSSLSPLVTHFLQNSVQNVKLTYETLSSGKPSYLANLIHLATPSRNVRFNKGPLLSVPKCKAKTRTRVFSWCLDDIYGFPLDIRFLSYAFGLEAPLNLITPRIPAL